MVVDYSLLCRRAKKKRAGLDASRTRREAKFGRIARRCAFCALKRTSSAPFWSGRVRTPPARGVASLDVDFRKLALRALFPPHTRTTATFFFPKVVGIIDAMRFTNTSTHAFFRPFFHDRNARA